MKVYHKQRNNTLLPRLSPDALIRLVLDEYFPTTPYRLKADFLSQTPPSIFQVGGAGTYLVCFFQKTGALSDQLGQILQSYLCVKENWTLLNALNPEMKLPSHKFLKVLVFVPSGDVFEQRLAEVLAVPVTVVSYELIEHGGEQALIINQVDDAQRKTEVPDHTPSRSASPAFDEQARLSRESLPVVPAKEIPSAPAPSVMAQTGGGSFYRRAKLSQDEMRALMDLDATVQDIRAR